MSRDACLWRGLATLHCWVASDWLLHKDLLQCNCGKKVPLRPSSSCYLTSFDKLISSNLGTLSMSRHEKGRWFSTTINKCFNWASRRNRNWDFIQLSSHQSESEGDEEPEMLVAGTRYRWKDMVRIAWLDPSQLSRPWGQELQLLFQIFGYWYLEDLQIASRWLARGMVHRGTFPSAFKYGFWFVVCLNDLFCGEHLWTYLILSKIQNYPKLIYAIICLHLPSKNGKSQRPGTHCGACPGCLTSLHCLVLRVWAVRCCVFGSGLFGHII